MRVLAVALILAITLAGCGDKKEDSTPTTDVEVQGNSIKGVVVTPSIKPIPGVTVKLMPGNLEDTTDLFGRFEFKDLDAGAYQLMAEAENHDPTTATVTVVEGESTRPRVILTPIAPPTARYDKFSFPGHIPASFGPAEETVDPYKEALGIEECDCTWIFNVPRYTAAVTFEVQWENQYSAPDPGPKPELKWTIAPLSLSHSVSGQGGTPIWTVLTEESFEGEGDFSFETAGTMSIKIEPGDVYPLSDQGFTIYVTIWEVDMPPDGWGITRGDQ